MASIQGPDGKNIKCPKKGCGGINLVKMNNSDFRLKCQNKYCLHEFYLPGLEPSTLDGSIRIDVLRRD
jgi:hypothetical protein